MREFVHHILAYLCVEPLPPEVVGISRPCSETTGEVMACQGGKGVMIGGWAVGGKVSFTFGTGTCNDLCVLAGNMESFVHCCQASLLLPCLIK